MLPSKNQDVHSHLTGAGESTWVRCLLLELIHWASTQEKHTGKDQLQHI